MDEKRTLNDIKDDIVKLVEEAEELLGGTISVDVHTEVTNMNPYSGFLPRYSDKIHKVRIVIE